MNKIVIVDDEVLVRANIKMLLAGCEDEFFICGEASNGAEALEILDKLLPDVVITDMKMPVLDGLALSAKIKNQYPKTAIIALSNYDDYEYVRGTLQNGAIDYILKHNLNRTNLFEALRKANEFREKNKVPHSDHPDKEVENNLIALRKKFIIQLLTGFYSDDAEVQSHILMLDIKLGAKNIIPIAMSIDGYFDTNKHLKNRNVVEYAIMNITNEILKDFGKGVICNVSDTIFCILISFQETSSKNIIDDKINSILWRIQSSLKQFINVSANFVVGNICSNFKALPSSYEEAEQCILNGVCYDRKAVTKIYDHQKYNRKLTGLDLDCENQLLNAVKAGNTSQLNTTVEYIFSEIERKKLDVTSSQIIFTDMLSIASRICKQYDIEPSSVYGSSMSIIEFLSTSNIEKIKVHFQNLFGKIATEIPSNPQKISSPYIRTAVEYIQNNYSKNISQQMIADEIGISSTYLSTLFKNEMSIGFTEYLTNLRLDQAKTLFKTGNHKIREVGELCGFYDYFYFFKVFKKKFGITPNEYLKRKGQKI